MSDRKIKDFWDWFSTNQQVLATEFTDLENVDEDNISEQTYARVESVLGQMMNELHKYDERLFPFCGLTHDGKVELIITAEGNIEAFSSAHAIVDAAPQFDKWQITALKPRAGDPEDGFEIFSMDGAVGDATVSYTIVKGSGENILLLVVPSNDDEVSEESAFMAVNLVESLLGEHDLATGFDSIDIVTSKRFEELDQDWQLKDVTDLPAEYDNRRLH